MLIGFDARQEPLNWEKKQGPDEISAEEKKIMFYLYIEKGHWAMLPRHFQL